MLIIDSTTAGAVFSSYVLARRGVICCLACTSSAPQFSKAVAVYAVAMCAAAIVGFIYPGAFLARFHSLSPTKSTPPPSVAYLSTPHALREKAKHPVY
jgi:hypothetical protein